MVFEVDDGVLLLAFGFGYGENLRDFLVDGDMDLEDTLAAKCDSFYSLTIHDLFHSLALETPMQSVLFILIQTIGDFTAYEFEVFDLQGTAGFAVDFFAFLALLIAC